MQDMLTQMKTSNKSLVYKGDKEKTENVYIAEREALVRQIRHLSQFSDEYTYNEDLEDDSIIKQEIYNTHSQC